MDLSVRKPTGLVGLHRCWECGAVPLDLVEVRSGGGAVQFIPSWPPGDHEHAERPPTPEELLEAGAATLLRILRQD